VAVGPAVQRITYASSADGIREPMMFYNPQTDAPRPLFVALHSWSTTYRQSASAIYAERADRQQLGVHTSPNKHATKHCHSTAHPIIESLEPGGEWDYYAVVVY
jgi:hypothetical protein